MAYWVASLTLIGFGLLAGFSIGQPFFLVGLAMLLLGSFRHRPLVFWPPMLAVVAYNVVYWAVAPFGCVAILTTDGVGMTSCSSLLGIHYEGMGMSNPSLRPAIFAGLLVAAGVAVSAFLVLYRTQRSRGRTSDGSAVGG